MSKVTPASDLSNLRTFEDFRRFCSQFLVDLEDCVNGNLEFDLNISSQTLQVTFTAANEDLAISHKLGKTGLRYFVIKKPQSLDVYDGAQAATDSMIFLRCTAAATVTLVLF